MGILPNPEWSGIVPVAHGAFDHEELYRLGLDTGAVIDFSASINPYGTPPGVRRAAKAAPMDSYPDRECHELRRKLGEHVGVDHACIAAGSGSAELIDHLARGYLGPGDRALIIGPTFGEYMRAIRLCGAQVDRFDRQISNGEVSLDLPTLLDTVRRDRPRIAWFCNPNNPTGDYLRRPQVEQLLEACVEAGTLLVIDEAYHDLMLSETPDSLVDLLPTGHLVLLRSMTKSYALAGLRLGYVLADASTVEVLSIARPPWNVSSPAQAAGIAALSLSAGAHLEASLKKLRRDAAYLRWGLERLGYNVVPFCANFMLVHVGDGARIRSQLLEHALQVRDCASFGLPEYIRISVRRHNECRKLLATLAESSGEHAIGSDGE